MSDYCLDDPNKNDCITFTISPILGQPEQVAEILDKKLPHDIKQMKHIPQEVINFIRDRKEFFSIVFILSDKQKSVNIQHLKADIATLSESPMLTEESRKKFKAFSQFLKKRNTNNKVLQNLCLISKTFGYVVEFLSIKHYTEAIYWFPDRDSVMEIANSIIKEIANLNINNAIGRRRKIPKIGIAKEDSSTREFIFDPFIRYPDIITGTISSVDLETHRVDKEKHGQLLKDAILDNPRIVLFQISPDLIHCSSLRSFK